MEVAYKDKKLALLETARAAETRLSAALITAFRNKLAVLKAAPDERTLRNWKSLHYEKLSGDRDGQRSIRLNAQWRLIFELDTAVTPPLLTILEIADYH
jgi:toxin HigB-1